MAQPAPVRGANAQVSILDCGEIPKDDSPVSTIQKSEHKPHVNPGRIGGYPRGLIAVAALAAVASMGHIPPSVKK